MPVAEAGTYTDQIAGTTVTLDGSDSADPDGTLVYYSWIQLGDGPFNLVTENEVTINNKDQVKATFIAPNVTDDAVLKFRLTVKDNEGNTDTDECLVTIVPGSGEDCGGDDTGGDSGDGDDGTVGGPTCANNLYFPHLEASGDWDSEIVILNTDSDDPMEGTLILYNASGTAIASLAITLPAMGRKEVTLSTDFADKTTAVYGIYNFSTGDARGYARIFKDDIYRAAYPGTRTISSGTVYLPHIAADGVSWDTTVSLVNTTDDAKTLTITFNTGDTKTVSLNGMAQESFTMSELFSGAVPSGIKNGFISESDCLVGVEVFEWGNMLGATLLGDTTEDHLYFPHVPDDSYWSTGIALYNPSGYPAFVTLIPYTSTGTALDPLAFKIDPWDSLVGLVGSLGFTEDAAWLDVMSTIGISAIDMFQTDDFQNYAGFSAIGMKKKVGYFPKIDGQGTGIAFVNLTYNTASITLKAYNDSGTVVATNVINVSAHQKAVGLAQELFTTDITGATYIGFSSDRDVACFVGNQSADLKMYDAIPAL